MLLNIILKTILRKEVGAMAVIYATLIVKGKKTINDVPMVIREQVKQILIDLDLPELAGRAKCSPFYYGGKEDLMVMATDADINIEHRLTEVEQRAKSNTNRLNEHDEILKSNSEMIGAIKELATEVKYMRGDLNETIERLNKLESKDGDKWEKFKWLIVAGLVTLILGYLAVSVGLK